MNLARGAPRLSGAMRQRLTFPLCLRLLGLFVITAGNVSEGFAQRDSGVALLIGNAAYLDAEAVLKEPERDVRALQDELTRRCFDVEVGQNLSKDGMQRALDRFYGKIKSGSTAVIFFSGIGIQSNRQNYLIPVNAQIWSETDISRDGFSLENTLDEMNRKGAHVKIAIIDASRTNPYERRFRSAPGGLTAVMAPSGTLVLSAASPGTVVNGDSPPVFMTDLLKELKTSDGTVERAFNRTRMDVARDSQNLQVPWLSSSLVDEFVLGPPGTAVQPSPCVGPVAPVANAVEPPTTPKPTTPPSTAETQHVATTAAKPSSQDDSEIHELNSTIDRDHNDWAAIYKRGLLYAKNGNFSDAIKDFDNFIRQHANDAEALNNRCWARALSGDLQGALKDCDDALKINPNYADALDSRGLVDLKSGKFSKAIADYDAALRLDPKHASALYGRGIAKRRSGSTVAGNSDIDAAIAIKSTIADEFASYDIR
jgi:TolA-binding protein